MTVDPTPDRDRRHRQAPSWLLALVLASSLLRARADRDRARPGSGRRSRRRSRHRPAAAIVGAWHEAIDTSPTIGSRGRRRQRRSRSRVGSRRGGRRHRGSRCSALADAYGAVRYGSHRPEADAARDAWHTSTRCAAPSTRRAGRPPVAGAPRSRDVAPSNVGLAGSARAGRVVAAPELVHERLTIARELRGPRPRRPPRAGRRRRRARAGRAAARRGSARRHGRPTPGPRR